MRLAAVLVIAAPSLAAAQAPGMYDSSPPLAPPGMTPPAGDTDEPPPAMPPPVNAVDPFRAPSLTQVAAPPALVLTPIELAAQRDSADDRAYGTSTALVVPDGKVDVSVRAAPIGGIASVTAGVGGGFEISADAGAVVGEEGVDAYGFGGKLALARKGGWALALQGSYHTLGDGDGDPLSLWSAGLVASGCTDHDCTALLSLGGGVLGATDNEGDTVPYAWASMLLGTGGFRPILEGTIVSDGMLGFLGARMGGRHAALDLGLGIVGGSGEGGALPVAALSVRP
jgi:hypothetical protein